MSFAINFLRIEAGIEDESLLSAPALIIPIAVFGQLKNNQLTTEDSKTLLYWLLVANARGRYSRGSTETYLNEDLALLFRSGLPSQLIDALKKQVTKLNIEKNDLSGRGHRSVLFSLAYLALKTYGAQDWYSGLGLSLTHQGRAHFVEYHHIFPKKELRDYNYEKSEINEIANLAFIAGGTNRHLGTKLPCNYFPEIINQRGDNALIKQAIPLDQELWKIENYRIFLDKRREKLTEIMNNHLSRIMNV